MSSVSGSDSDDEKDYYDFQFAKASKKHSKGNDTAAEKILRSLLNRAKEQPKSYLQPGGDRHYNTTSLLLEVLLGQDKVPEALSLCRDAIRDIENVLGAGNMLCQMLKEDENGILRTMGIDDEEESQEVRDVQPSRTETQVAGSTSESSVPPHLASLGTETSVIEKRPYYETMALEVSPPAPPIIYQESTATVVAPAIETQAVQVQPETETMVIEPASTVRAQETEVIQPVTQKPIIPQLELGAMSLADPVETNSIAETVFDIVERENTNLLSPVATLETENRVSRSSSLFRKGTDSRPRKNPQSMQEYDGKIWPPYDEENAMNILLVGDRGCGKSALRRQLLRIHRFSEDYIPTSVENSIDTGLIDDGKYYPSVKITEVSDFNEYLDRSQTGDATSPKIDTEQVLRRMAIANTELYVLCFSVDNMDSLRNIEVKWMRDIQRLEQSRLGSRGSKAAQTLNLILVACKSDEWLNPSTVMMKSQPSMTAEYLKAQYFEVSTKTGEGIKELSRAIGRIGHQASPELINEHRTKVFFVGDTSAGKTYLIGSLSGQPFAPPPPQEEFAYRFSYINYRSSNGEHFAMEVGDTSGYEDYDRMRPLGFPGTNIVCFCFDISNPDSFDNIEERWWPMLYHFLPTAKFILIGCQKDKRYDEKILEDLGRYKQHPVTPEAGEEFRQKMGAFKYIETSIYTGEGILDVKEALAELIRTFQSSNAQPIKKYSSVRKLNIFRRK